MSLVKSHESLKSDADHANNIHPSDAEACDLNSQVHQGPPSHVDVGTWVTAVFDNQWYPGNNGLASSEINLFYSRH